MRESNHNLVLSLHHDAVFIAHPLKYVRESITIIDDIQLKGMDLNTFKEYVRRLVRVGNHICSLFTYRPGIPLSQGIRMVKNDSDVAEFVDLAYEHGSEIDIYVEHEGHDVLEFSKNDVHCVDYESEEEHPVPEKDLILEEFVSDEFESEDNVVIERHVTEDPFLTHLCGKVGYINYQTDPAPHTEEVPMEDPDEAHLDNRFKIKKGVQYPVHDPTIPWNLMKHVLRMRFEHLEQMRLMLESYGVANRYQLWYMRSIHKCLLVYCGRSIEEGRYASGLIRKKIKDKKLQASENDCEEGDSSTNKEGNETPCTCPFRLWASWMSTEKSFQIKSLILGHNCGRNYNFGSLVTYRWIAARYAKEIMDNRFITLRFMVGDIREKYMIDVSLGQCKRAKHRALYVHEGGLIEHYARLWHLESNPGSTCHLNFEELKDGHIYFSRIYMCFQGLKYGWIAGCRRIIGLDGCFLKGTCRGELLTAMGRDANNQMFPIAWAVVSIENKENWSWFVELLRHDPILGHGESVTIILDGHKEHIIHFINWILTFIDV